MITIDQSINEAQEAVRLVTAAIREMRELSVRGYLEHEISFRMEAMISMLVIGKNDLITCRNLWIKEKENRK